MKPKFKVGEEALLKASGGACKVHILEIVTFETPTFTHFYYQGNLYLGKQNYKEDRYDWLPDSGKYYKFQEIELQKMK